MPSADEILLNEVDIALATTAGTPNLRSGAAVWSAEVRLFEVQVWPRNAALFQPPLYTSAAFENYIPSIFVDSPVQRFTALPAAFSSGPRGSRFQVYARSVAIEVFVAVPSTSQMIIATRVAAVHAPVAHYQPILLISEGVAIPLPRFCTEYRVLGCPGETHTLVDPSGVAVTHGGLGAGATICSEIPNYLTDDWTPLHPWAAGIKGDTETYLRVEVR